MLAPAQQSLQNSTRVDGWESHRSPITQSKHPGHIQRTVLKHFSKGPDNYIVIKSPVIIEATEGAWTLEPKLDIDLVHLPFCSLKNIILIKKPL